MKSKKAEACPQPAGLSPSAGLLWRRLVPHRARSLGRQLLLEALLRARDRAEEFRLLIAEQGLIEVTKGTGMPHLNPAVKAEKEARGQFAKLAGLLSLQWDNLVDGRGVDDYEDSDDDREQEG